MDGSLQEGQRAPSTNELAQQYEINPATARKGLNLLVEAEILEKRRGLGMFVTHNAKEIIRSQRAGAFVQDFVSPLIEQAIQLEYDRDFLIHLIDQTAQEKGMRS